MMARCPVCKAELPDGHEYCPPCTFKPGFEEIQTLEFNGCYGVRFEVVWSPNRLGARHYGVGFERVKPKTEAARFREAYGDDCLQSMHGPLPVAGEGKTGGDPQWMNWGG